MTVQESDRSKAWSAFVRLQNEARQREGLPPFDANLREYAPMMSGFYEGHRAAKFDEWMAGAMVGWEASGEGWNGEMACGDPAKMPNFFALSPHKPSTGGEGI